MKLSPQELKRRSLMRLAGLTSGKTLTGPEEVVLHITNQCNLSCRFCFYHAPKSPHQPPKHQHMALRRVLSILNDCVDLNVDRIIFSGEGEPSSHPHFQKMLRHLEPLPLSVSLFSNGAFPARYCRDIIRAQQIVINLGALNAKTYHAVHGKNLFSHVTANIHRLAQLRKTHNQKFRIEVTYLLNTLNLAPQQKILLFMKSLGVDATRISVANSFEHTRPIHLPSPRAQHDIKPVPCGWYSASVRLDGKLNICCYLPHEIAADLNAVSLKKAWHSGSFKRMRQTVLSGKYWNMHDGCCHCSEWLRRKSISAVVARRQAALDAKSRPNGHQRSSSFPGTSHNPL